MQVEQLLNLVEDAEILTAAEVQEWAAYWKEGGRSPGDGEGMITALLEEKILTEFHAEAIRNGVPGPYLVGPYRVSGRVAVGRLGAVYKAVHEEFQQPVGLKIYSPQLQRDRERAMRLARETRIAVQVDHPHVVRTFQVGRVGETVFLAIEDLSGCTLADRLEGEGLMDPLETCRLIREAALGLHHLHSLEIVHRDIQPANIWLTESGHAKLMDFGAARDAMADALDHNDDEEHVALMNAELLGSLDYLSAEQAADEHNAEPRSDIYSLGCVAYRCLTGNVVFPDMNPVRKMARHANEPPLAASDANPDVPDEISDVVATMLSKKPEDRFQTAEDAAWALEQVIGLEERQLDVNAEISGDFLDWARSCDDLVADDEVPTVAADPGFIEFVHWLSKRDEDD